MPSTRFTIPLSYTASISPGAVRSTTASNADPLPNLSRGRFDELLSNYRQDLEFLRGASATDLYTVERELINELNANDFFYEMQSMYSGDLANYVFMVNDDVYDPNNLMHRLTMIYANYFIAPVQDFVVRRANLPRPRIMYWGGDFVRLDRRNFVFLVLCSRDVIMVNELNETLTIPSQPEEPEALSSVHYIINGQKIKFGMQTRTYVSGRGDTRYTQTLTITVSSERGTQVRSLFHLISNGREFRFKRIANNRPYHGFHFSMKRGIGLVVKEISG